MSLSTLQAQLAVLNSTSISSSTITIGTKQHTDRIGRGLQYSVQQGSHIHQNSNSSHHPTKYQPTLFYDTTRIAADIPLSTLQQQYEQAIQQLTSRSSSSSRTNSDTYPHILQYLSSILVSSSSSSSSTNNNNVVMTTNQTTTIRQIIMIVSSLLSECCCDSDSRSGTDSSSSLSTLPLPQQHEYYLPCMYILEYLLRQYHIHTTNNAIDLLWCFLPVSNILPTLLHRCLLLCDWASHSSYLWLRPYCQEEITTTTTNTSSSSNSINLPTRTLIAISTMKHVDLLRYVCQMVRTIQSMTRQEQQSTEASHNNDNDDDDDDNATFVLSTGMSHILSYTVAILVEGLQYIQKNHSSNTSLLENIIRTLLPTIRSMTTTTTTTIRHQNNNMIVHHPLIHVEVEEFYSWGYIVATTMVETMSSILSTSVIQTLCHIMIVASCGGENGGDGHSNWNPNHPHDNHSSSIRQNGIVCLFSILFPHGRTNHGNNNLDGNDTLCCIPLVVAHGDPNKKNPNKNLKYIGCTSFNTFLYNALLEQTNVEMSLPHVLGELLLLESSSSSNGSPEYNKMLVITASFLCAIIATFVHQLSNDDDDDGTKSTNTMVAMKLIVSLLENTNLQQLLWRNVRLNVISSITVFILHAAVAVTPTIFDAPDTMMKNDDDDTSKVNVDSFQYHRTILLALNQCDSVQTERGIAFALLNPRNNTDDPSNQTIIDRQHQYLVMKSLLRDIIHMENEGGDSGDALVHMEEENTDSMMNLLLPPNVAIEHPNAMIRLQAIQQYVTMIESNPQNHSKQFERLLRQMLSDTSIEVQLAIGEMMAGWFEQDDRTYHDLVTEENAMIVMELLLTYIYRFNANDKVSILDDDIILTTQYCISILVHVAQIAGQLGRDEFIQLWQLSLEALIGMIGKNYNPTIVEHIELAIPVLFGDDDPTNSGNVFSMIVDCEPFINRLLQRENVQFQMSMKDEIREVQRDLRRTCEIKVVEKILEMLRDDSAMQTTEQMEQRNVYADHSLSLCMNQFRTCTNDDILTTKDLDTITACLLESWKTLLPELDAERIPILLTEIASTDSIQLWSCMAGSGFQSLISNIHNRYGMSVLPFIVLFESIMRLHSDTTSSSVIAQKRMMSVAKKMIGTEDNVSRTWFTVIPALSLLQSNDRGIRIAASNLLKEIDHDVNPTSSSDKNTNIKSSSLEAALLKDVCRHIPIAKSHAKLDEQNFLPTFLAKCIRESSDASALRDTLLTHCLSFALSCSDVLEASSSEKENFRWLSLENAIGGSIAATIVLDATEMAGEVAFPLISRWNLVGTKLLCTLTSAQENKAKLVSYRPHLVEVIRRCGMMIKGVTVTDPVMIVSTGPISSRQGIGGRARSYSVGKMDGISLLAPYPAEMVDRVIGVLALVEDNKCAKFIANEVLQPALTSAAWGAYVFKTLDEVTRHKIAIAVIKYLESESIYDLPIGIQLSAYDMSAIINNYPHSCTILVECIRNNVERLASEKEVVRLISNVFDLLENYSSRKVDQGIEGVELLIHDALISVSSLLQTSLNSSKRGEISDSVLLRWIGILLNLLGLKGMITFRSRSAVLTILTNLCSHFPKRVAPSLIQAPISIVLNCPANQSIGQIALQAFSKIVPSFIQYGIDAGLSLTDFLYHFVDSMKTLEDPKQAVVYRELSKALSFNATTVDPSKKLYGSIGALQAFYLAFEARNSVALDDEVDQINFTVDLLQYSSEEEQLSSLLLLLNYSIGLLSLFHDDAQQHGLRTMDKLLPTHYDIAVVASAGTKPTKATKGTRQLCLKTDAGRKAIRTTIMRILRTFSEGLMLESTCESIESSIGEVSKLSLLLWQDLLLLQSLTHITPKGDYLDDDNVQFQEGIANLVTESREYLQTKLPSHLFLASVAALIKDGGTAEIRSHALRLLAERVLTVDSDSSEALLYIDVVPIINEVIHSDNLAPESAHSELVLLQSAMYSIDHITRQLFIPLSGPKPAMVNQFLESLRNCSRILLDCSNKTSDMGQMSALTGDLISTTALCCASLVRAIGVPSLSVLPNLMKALIAVLKVANIGIISSGSSDVNKQIAKARVTQLSVLRCLLAIIETIPQFLPPYLSNLLTSSAILCNSLRCTTDDTSLTVQVVEIADKVSIALSKNVAARIMIPAASKALQKSILSSEMKMLMYIIETSIDATSTATVVSHKDDVLIAITKSLQYEGTWEEYSLLVAASSNLLHTMVMKVSEIELRRIYQSLRKWCGDITGPNENARQRYGFWSLSARLGKELRTIFLPCLDLVTDDVIAELNIAVTILCPPRMSKVTTNSPSKKQKIDHLSSKSSSPPNIMSMRILQPILAMIEYCLRADAYQGGQWTRGGGDSQHEKFEQLLNPIGKLLFSRIPSNFPVPQSTTDPYRYLIEGEGNDSVMNEEETTTATTTTPSINGSVIGCLSALALVGGNEQLWKPLNQVMMEACSGGDNNNNENRSEVRRAGLLCLLELIKSLGDEYIVLLPENLPLLSELLEDSNEDVARLARDVVTQAEELLGESLEDSLR